MPDVDGPLLRCRVQRDAAATVVHVAGEVDVATAADLAEAVDEALADRSPLVVVDLHEVSFLGTVGLKVLLDAHEEVERTGRRLLVTDGAPVVRRLLEVSGLHQVLTVVPTVRDALAG